MTTKTGPSQDTARHGFKPWNRICTAVLDVVFPPRCLLCKAPADGKKPHLCAECHRTLGYEMAQPPCPRCGHSIGPFGVRQGRCFVCRNEPKQVDRLVRVGPYRDATASLVRAFKYGGHDELDAYLGDLLAEVIEVADWFAEVDAVVYVPTHWRHAIGRMFYAPKALARVVSRATRIPVARVIRRVQAGPHQLNVPRSQRAANIRGKFGMIPGARVEGARLCLLDDVSTTGATINECARVLKKAGAGAVFAAVIAKVDTESHQVD